MALVLGALVACGGQSHSTKDRAASDTLARCAHSWNATQGIADTAKAGIGLRAGNSGGGALTTLDGRGKCAVVFPESFGTSPEAAEGLAYAWVRDRGEWKLFMSSYDLRASATGVAQLRAWEDHVTHRPNSIAVANGDVKVTRNSAPAPLSFPRSSASSSAEAERPDDAVPSQPSTGTGGGGGPGEETAGLGGVWTGVATQHAPRGSPQRVQVTLDIVDDEPGAVGKWTEDLLRDPCGGSVVVQSVGPGDQYQLRYHEKRNPDACIGSTEIRVDLESPERMRIRESYTTSLGPGKVDGFLNRTQRTPRVVREPAE